jgi:hypothetical protein
MIVRLVSAHCDVHAPRTTRLLRALTSTLRRSSSAWGSSQSAAVAALK